MFCIHICIWPLGQHLDGYPKRFTLTHYFTYHVWSCVYFMFNIIILFPTLALPTRKSSSQQQLVVKPHQGSGFKATALKGLCVSLQLYFCFLNTMTDFYHAYSLR